MSEENGRKQAEGEVAETGATAAADMRDESPSVQPSFQPSTQGPAAGTSAGAMLRHARETAGVDLSSLALALKISVKKLEALEANRHEDLTDSVFIRALASSVCRTLKIDAAPILERLPKSNAPKLVANDETGLNAPFRTPGDVAKTPFWEHLSRPVVLAALAVLLGALVLILFPSSGDHAEVGTAATRPSIEGQGGDAASSETSEEAKNEGAGASAPVSTNAAVLVPQAGIPAAPMVTTPVGAPGAPRTGGLAPAFTPAPAVTAGAARPAPTSPASAAAPAALTPAATPSILARGVSPNGAAPNLSTVPARSTAPASAPAAPSVADDEDEPKFARSGAVVFRLREPGWVQVMDASGAIRINRVLEANKPVGVVNGPFPLTVTVGRPEVTDVLVRGKPFDLTPTIQNGQAKFEVQ